MALSLSVVSSVSHLTTIRILILLGGEHALLSLSGITGSEEIAALTLALWKVINPFRATIGCISSLLHKNILVPGPAFGSFNLVQAHASAAEDTATREVLRFGIPCSIGRVRMLTNILIEFNELLFAEKIFVTWHRAEDVLLLRAIVAVDI